MTASATAVGLLAERCDALRRCVRAVWPHVAASDTADAGAIAAAGEVGERGAARLRIAGDHTVVALAGATGGGKSSLFNALARMELSSSGHLRPTTAEAHACVWGGHDSDELLDWLGVARRFRRESPLDADDEAPLRGLVLLDLPDLDSVVAGHRVEAERLIGVADLVIWVLDPQKYADQTVHDDHLRRLGALREATVVVFNQVDRLTPVDAVRCRADLARLVEADGLPGVPVLATSALTGEGVDDVHALLEKAVAGRRAALTRLEGELDEAVMALAPMVGSAPAAGLSREAVGDLANELATAAGVPTVAAQDAGAYARRASIPGWPFRRRGSDATDVPPAEPHAVSAAIRRLARRASVGLPPPWPDEAEAAVIVDGARVPGELGEVVRAARPPRPRAVGWAAIRVVWWLGVAAVLGGAGLFIWYGVRGARPAEVAGVPVPAAVLAVGALTAVVVLALGRPLATARARRWQSVVERRLRDAVARVARELVAPVRAVVRDHAEAREALRAAAPHRDLDR